MADPMRIALTGMRAAETRVAVAADNTANQLSTAPAPKTGESYQGYTPKTVDTVSQVRGGVRTQINPADPAFTLETKPGQTEPTAFPNVDLAAEQVQMMTAQHAYQANANIIRTQQDMDKTLLDIKS